MKTLQKQNYRVMLLQLSKHLTSNKQGRQSVIVDRIGYDKEGHTVYTKLDNGTETTYTYDKQRERLQIPYSRQSDYDGKIIRKIINKEDHCIKNYARLKDIDFGTPLYMFVISLSGYAKIITEKAYRGYWILCCFALRQGADYLASDFFRMEILNIFSARSIIVELARLRSFSLSNSFLRRLSSASCSLRSLDS